MNAPPADERAALTASAASLDLKLEIVIISVADVDRAKRFYAGLGWRLDADFTTGEDWRVVQFTPPGSPCSIIFGKGITAAAPGSVPGLFLIVKDIEATHADLRARGADVSDIFHFEAGLRVLGTKGRVPGPDPEGRSYRSFASFSDPDGNGWLVQEIKTRLPGRGLNLDVADLTELLREAEEQHGVFAANSVKHHWSEWYAAYIIARTRGKSIEDAGKEGTLHIEAAPE